MKKFKVGIIGFGLIGQKRAKNLGPKAELIACCDIANIKKNFLYYEKKKIKFYNKWQDLLKLKELDLIIISTFHNLLGPILLEACKYKKNIFVEKPAAIDLKDLNKIIKLAKKNKQKIRVGYNHRFLSSIIKCKELLDKNILGNLMFIKASYGHGGRSGYDKEWRMNPKISGGGELIDQGSHLIDLSQFFLGNIDQCEGTLRDFFWKKGVDDNAFLTLKFKNNLISFLHVSCTEWKNNFLFEIYGSKGKLRITGKGGSYGKESLTFYKMNRKNTFPKIFSFKFSNEDLSWRRELSEFYRDIELNRDPNPGLLEAYNVLKVIKKIYKINQYDYSS